MAKFAEKAQNKRKVQCGWKKIILLKLCLEYLIDENHSEGGSDGESLRAVSDRKLESQGKHCYAISKTPRRRLITTLSYPILLTAVFLIVFNSIPYQYHYDCVGKRKI